MSNALAQRRERSSVNVAAHVLARNAHFQSVVARAFACVATAIHAREQIVDDRFLTAVLPSEQTVDMHVNEALAQLRDGYCELVSVSEIT
jgi:hypothetical protein